MRRRLITGLAGCVEVHKIDDGETNAGRCYGAGIGPRKGETQAKCYERKSMQNKAGSVHD